MVRGVLGSARYVLWDAVRRLRRPLAPTLVAVLIAFAATGALFATTGLAVAGQQRAIDVINSPAGRLITAVDTQGNAGLSPASIESVAALSGVEWAVGVGVARDVRNVGIPGGASVPSRLIYGELPPPLVADRAQPLLPGRALAAHGVARTLGLSDGVGAVRGTGVATTVVGSFVAREPLQALRDTVVVAPDGSEVGERLTTIWVSVKDVSQLPALTDAVRASLVAESRSAVQIETAEELALLGEDVTAALAENARWTLLGLLLAVIALVATVQFGRVAGLARDIGRVRALGATRTLVVVQMLANALVCGTAGAALGTAFGTALTWVIVGAIPPGDFIASIAVLVILAAVLGAVAPAVRAARLDPVSILRVP